MANQSNAPDAQQLAERYRELSDDGLSMLVTDAGDLTPLALEVLNRELSNRGMETVQPGFQEDYVEAVRPVILERFMNLHEALLARGQLESSGIASWLADDNMVRMDWFISNLLGGVKLVVRPEDEAAAREVLGQPIPENFDVEGADPEDDGIRDEGNKG